MTTAEKRKACWYVVPKTVTSIRCSTCLHSLGHSVTQCVKHRMRVKWLAVCKDFNPKISTRKAVRGERIEYDSVSRL
jgi:hypothetical protein